VVSCRERRRPSGGLLSALQVTARVVLIGGFVLILDLGFSDLKIEEIQVLYEITTILISYSTIIFDDRRGRKCSF